MKTDKIIIEQSKSEKTEANGVIGVNPNKPDFGSIMLRTTSWNNSDGFLNKTSKVHFLAGKVEDLQELCSEFSLAVGSDYSVAIAPSRLVIEESTTPYFEGQQAKVNPETGEEITYNGMPVYRQVALIAASSSKVDRFVADAEATTADAEITSEELPELNS